MTRALIVERDPLVGEGIAATLGMAGYAVSRCRGPAISWCPLLSGCACPLVERADVLVYAVAEARTIADGHALIDGLRSLYGDRALVLRGRSAEPTARRSAAPDAEQLILAIEDALADRGQMAG